MNRAATALPLPTKSQLERWQSTHLTDAASQWRVLATESEDVLDQHRSTIAAPGGSEWLGEAKDAALRRVSIDLTVVGQQSAVQRTAADIAERGANDVRGAQRAALDAVAEAEADGFTVGEDLSVIDTLSSDSATADARNTAASEHAEYIRWHAEQLIQTDGLIGRQLMQKAVELQSIRFDGEGETANDGTIRAVDFKQGPAGQAESEADRRQNEKDAFKEVFRRADVVGRLDNCGGARSAQL